MCYEHISKQSLSLFIVRLTPARIILHANRAKLRESSAPECSRPMNCIPTIFNANENEMIRSIPVHSYWFDETKQKIEN